MSGVGLNYLLPKKFWYTTQLHDYVKYDGITAFLSLGTWSVGAKMGLKV